MARNASFEQFKGDLTEADLANLVKLAKKRRLIYIVGHICCVVVAILVQLIVQWVAKESNFMVLSIIIAIPILAMGIFAGLGAYTNNVICFIASRGRRDGGGLTSILWAIFGGLIIPLITIFACNHTFLWKKILGWGKSGVTFTNGNRL